MNLFLKRTIKNVTHLIPDKPYLQLRYRWRMGRKLNLDNPQTFTEKLQWLKLYDRRPEYTMMVDKFAVKEYVANMIGEEYIIPTLGVWDKFEDIDFNKLPDQFVLKCTHDSASTIVVQDKAKLDIAAAGKRMRSRLKTNYYWGLREWPYKDVKPRIIAERYMEDAGGGELLDYKFFCFDGVVKVLYIVSNRINEEEINVDFFDMNYRHLDCAGTHYSNAKNRPQKPASFEAMKLLSAKLSNGIPYVRVDFYEVNGKVYFGELTFFPTGGYFQFIPEKWDYIFGSWIYLPQKIY